MSASKHGHMTLDQPFGRCSAAACWFLGERTLRVSFHRRPSRQLWGAPVKLGKYNTAPTRQTLTTAWDEELSDGAKRAILAVSERLVDIAHENDNALDLRQPRHVEENDSDLRERQVGDFSDDQIRQTIRLARDTIFGAFNSGRAVNAIYPDSRFDELQALMSLCECGTPQGQSRMANFFGADYTPHGDTHLRTVQPYSKAAMQAGFDQSIENLLKAVNHLQILQSPVTAAIDIRTWPYHADDDSPREVSGTDDSGEMAYKFATLPLVGKSMPIVLAVEPVIESSAWDENLPHQYHRTVRRFVRRARYSCRSISSSQTVGSNRCRSTKPWMSPICFPRSNGRPKQRTSSRWNRRMRTARTMRTIRSKPSDVRSVNMMNQYGCSPTECINLVSCQYCSSDRLGFRCVRKIDIDEIDRP